MLNLPKKILQQAYDRLKKIPEAELTHTSNVKEIIFLIKERLDNYSLDEKQYTQFTDMIKKRDQYRKVHIKDYMPELAREINS